jgi:hypothetical protein
MANKMRNLGVDRKQPIPVAKGIYNRNPSPGLSDYPADVGPNDIDVKFAETGVGDASMQTNKMRMQDTSRGRAIPQVATTSNMKKGPNKTRKFGTTTQFSGSKK